MSASEEELVFVILFIVAVLFIVFLIISKINSTKCPSCKKRWSKKFINKEILSKTPFYKTVTRYDIKRDAQVNEINRTERREQVHMQKITYRFFYECKKCGYS